MLQRAAGIRKRGGARRKRNQRIFQEEAHWYPSSLMEYCIITNGINKCLGATLAQLVGQLSINPRVGGLTPVSPHFLSTRGSVQRKDTEPVMPKMQLPLYTYFSKV